MKLTRTCNDMTIQTADLYTCVVVSGFSWLGGKTPCVSPGEGVAMTRKLRCFKTTCVAVLSHPVSFCQNEGFKKSYRKNDGQVSDEFTQILTKQTLFVGPILAHCLPVNPVSVGIYGFNLMFLCTKRKHNTLQGLVWALSSCLDLMML